MKVYYNGKQVRTSKTHNYTHAVIDLNGKAISCHSTKEAAEKQIRSKLSSNEQVREGVKRVNKNNPEALARRLADCDRWEAEIKSWKIVELEARD